MILKLQQWAAAHQVPPAALRSLFPRLLAILLGNATVAYLVLLGLARPLELVLFVALEAMLLTTIAMVQERFTSGQRARPSLGRAVLNQLGVILICLLILAFNSVVIASMLHAEAAALALARHPLETILRARLVWPLSITLVAALFDVRRDAKRFAQQGGEFDSTPGENGAARWLTLIFGAMPHAIPLLAYVAIVSRYFRRRAERLKSAAVSAPVSRVAIAVLGLYLVATLVFLSWLLKSGLAGWTVAFFSAKISSEVLVVVAAVLPTSKRKKGKAAQVAPAAA
ncbi:MAG: hypothetical protein ABI609_00930 [Acidobacteriota bacterium]